MHEHYDNFWEYENDLDSLQNGYDRQDYDNDWDDSVLDFEDEYEMDDIREESIARRYEDFIGEDEDDEDWDLRDEDLPIY